MLKRTVKISLCLLLHVSVQLDHPHGAYAESCQSYNIVELISESTSLMICGVLALVRLSIRSLKMVQLDRNM